MTLESISAKPPMGLDYLRNAQWGECKSVCVRAIGIAIGMISLHDGAEMLRPDWITDYCLIMAF